MPAIAKKSLSQAVVNDSIPLPKSFPALPDDVRKRFPSISQYEEDVERWWKSAGTAITEFNRQGTTIINRNYQNAQTLRVSVNGLTAQIEEINEVIIIDGEASARRLITVSAMAGVPSNIDVQPTPPAGPSLNDYWIDTSDPAIPITYKWDGSSWVEVTEPISYAGVAQEQTARVNADTILATNITTVSAALTTEISDRIAAVTNEQTARISADNVLASNITTVSAGLSTEISDRIAAVTAEQTARISADNVLASNITTVSAGLSTEVSDRIAAVSSEQTARINADNTLASDITTVSAAVSTETTNRIAAVSAEATARATADGFLEGKYTLTVTTGDVVTGMNITSSTGSGTNVSSVIFRATDFKIYNSVTGVAMFTVSGTAIKLGSTLTVDTANSKIFIGTGTFQDAGTPFYVDSTGDFSLGTGLSWDGSTLDVNGVITSDSGTIGGFTLSSQSILAGSGTAYIEVASDVAAKNFGIQLGSGSTVNNLNVTSIHIECTLNARTVFNLSARDEVSTNMDHGYLRLNSTTLGGATKKIELRAENGTVEAQSGFIVNGTSGISGSFDPTTLSDMTFVGGILTSTT